MSVGLEGFVQQDSLRGCLRGANPAERGIYVPRIPQKAASDLLNEWNGII
jgi:hypothetical protein